MSQENPDAGRSVEERVLLSLPPPVVRLLSRGYARLPPGSHLRRRATKRFIARTYDALNREDDVFSLLIYEPDIVIRSSREFSRLLGLPESYHGHEGFLAWWRDVRQGMDEVLTRPEQVIDLGDRVAIRLAFLTRGRASGAITDRTVGIIAHMTPRGRVPRLEWYWTWEETLEALGDHSGTLRASGGGGRRCRRTLALRALAISAGLGASPIPESAL
jgi:ketosteroid isomerase-like protein